MKAKPVLCLLASLATIPLVAQLSAGGEPWAWAQRVPVQDELPVFEAAMPAEPLAPLTADFRWGEPRIMVLDIPSAAHWIDLPDGGQLARLVVTSPGALGLAFQFDRWDLPEGALVYLYDVARTYFIGGFDHSNRSPLNTMATEVLPGDAVVIEFRLPAGSPMGALRISGVTHSIMDFHRRGGDDRDFNPGFQSSPCHINMACPEAAGWQQEKRAVVMFIRADGQGCTGTLINNTAVPGRPLVYLADHCNQETHEFWVFYFNYEAPACIGDTGSTAQTMTGAVKLAGYGLTGDFVIAELFNAIPPAFMPYFAGWDRTDAIPQTGTVIHHPLYDVKKITFDYDPSTQYVDDIGIPMWRQYWDLGIVEAVSSGAALWDQNRRIVGHMTEGSQDCTNAATVHTGCAKFSAGWDGFAPNVRKRDWLDPSNTVFVLDGYDPFGVPEVRVDLRAFLDGAYVPTQVRMRDDLRTQGLLPMTEPYTSAGYAHTGGGGGESVAPAVLAVTGDPAIVDWVVLELRAAAQPTTVLASRAALIRRDGKVVDVNGTAAVGFPVAAGNYHVTLRHRNHLGVMTASPVALSATPAVIDLRDGPSAAFGGEAALKTFGTRRALFAGDATGDEILKYTGAENDRDAILVRIGGVQPTAMVTGYFPEDVNMDGQVKYTGEGNDRDPILLNLGGTIPSTIKPASLP